jgi:cell division septum initiation protein DivIVA
MSLSQKIKDLKQEIEKKRSAVTNDTAALIELENQLKNLPKIEELNESTPDDLPKGFTIIYDNRRGYSEFTPFWRLYLRNKNGDLIEEWYAHADKYSEEEATVLLRNQAWKVQRMVDAVNSHTKRSTRAKGPTA